MTNGEGLVPIGGTRIKLIERGAIIPDDTTFEEAQSGAWVLPRLHGASRWAYIDLIHWAFEQFGEAAQQLIDETQMHPTSIVNLYRVYRYFPPGSRKWDLSISHYQATAVTYLSQEDREKILGTAEKESWNRDQVRHEVALHGPAITRYTFPKEAFISNVTRLLVWAKENNAPKDILDMVEELFLEYKKEVT